MREHPEVIVRVWSYEHNNKEHVSLQIGDFTGNARPLGPPKSKIDPLYEQYNNLDEQGKARYLSLSGKKAYISLYPNELKNLAWDKQHYTVTHNVEARLFRLSGLDVEKMLEAYCRIIDNGFKYKIYGSAFFKASNTFNCNGIVYELLHAGGFRVGRRKNPKAWFLNQLLGGLALNAARSHEKLKRPALVVYAISIGYAFHLRKIEGVQDHAINAALAKHLLSLRIKLFNKFKERSLKNIHAARHNFLLETNERYKQGFTSLTEASYAIRTLESTYEKSSESDKQRLSIYLHPYYKFYVGAEHFFEDENIKASKKDQRMSLIKTLSALKEVINDFFKASEYDEVRPQVISAIKYPFINLNAFEYYIFLPALLLFFLLKTIASYALTKDSHYFDEPITKAVENFLTPSNSLLLLGFFNDYFSKHSGATWALRIIILLLSGLQYKRPQKLVPFLLYFRKFITFSTALIYTVINLLEVRDNSSISQLDLSQLPQEPYGYNRQLTPINFIEELVSVIGNRYVATFLSGIAGVFFHYLVREVVERVLRAIQFRVLHNPNALLHEIIHSPQSEELISKEIQSVDIVSIKDVDDFCKKEQIPDFVPIIPDGNCFFRSVLAGQGSSPDKHAELRTQVIKYIRQNQRLFEHALPPEFHCFEDYIHEISREGAWADGLIIEATVLCLDLPIHIIDLQKNDNAETEVVGNFTCSKDSENASGTVYLIRVNDNHYHSICGSVNQPIKLPCSVTYIQSTLKHLVPAKDANQEPIYGGVIPLSQYMRAKNASHKASTESPQERQQRFCRLL